MKKIVIAASAIAMSTWLFVACENSNDGVGKDSNNPGSTDINSSDGNGTDGSTSNGTNDGTGNNGTETGNNNTDPVSTDDEKCAETGFNIEVNPINMLILLDRSRSMVESKVGGQTFAKVVSQAIKNVVQTNDDKDLVNFGLAVFPDLACDKTSGDTPSEDVQCKASTSTVVDIGPDNFSQISSQLDSIGTCGGTPICHSLNWAKSYLTTLDNELSKFETYILLATDGAPNCNTTGDIGSCECTADKTPQGVCPGKILCLDDKCSYNEALSLRKQGNKMFVIGVGDEAASWDDVMNKMAEYGGTGAYYPAGDPASLASALENITGEAISCNFDVAWDDVPEKSGDGRNVDKKCNKVRVLKIADMDNPNQTENIPYSYDCSDPNGWRWKGLDKELDPDSNDDTPLSECSTIELCSNACASLKNGETERVTATFGCGIVPVL